MSEENFYFDGWYLHERCNAGDITIYEDSWHTNIVSFGGYSSTPCGGVLGPFWVFDREVFQTIQKIQKFDDPVASRIHRNQHVETREIMEKEQETMSDKMNADVTLKFTDFENPTIQHFGPDTLNPDGTLVKDGNKDNIVLWTWDDFRRLCRGELEFATPYGSPCDDGDEWEKKTYRITGICDDSADGTVSFAFYTDNAWENLDITFQFRHEEDILKARNIMKEHNLQKHMRDEAYIEWRDGEGMFVHMKNPILIKNEREYEIDDLMKFCFHQKTVDNVIENLTDHEEYSDLLWQDCKLAYNAFREWSLKYIGGDATNNPETLEEMLKIMEKGLE